MPTRTEIASPANKSERAPCSDSVIGSGGSCPICGTPLQGRQRCCSGKCRAALSRRNRVPLTLADARALLAVLKGTMDRVAQVQADATVVLHQLWEAKDRLERAGVK